MIFTHFRFVSIFFFKISSYMEKLYPWRRSNVSRMILSNKHNLSKNRSPLTHVCIVTPDMSTSLHWGMIIHVAFDMEFSRMTSHVFIPLNYSKHDLWDFSSFHPSSLSPFKSITKIPENSLFPCCTIKF